MSNATQRKPPGLRQKRNGAYFVRWGGTDHYLSKDHTEALDLYMHDSARGLPAWRRWLAEKRQHRSRRVVRTSLTIDKLAEMFLQSRLAEGGPERKRFYATHLRRFREGWGDSPAAFVRVAWLQHLKDRMLFAGKSPGTINKDITSVQTMYRWAMGLELVPPVMLAGVRKLPLGEIKDKSLRADAVKTWIAAADARLKPWLAVNYLCGMRPIEVVRAVHAKASGGFWDDRQQWVQRGVLRIPNKMGWKTRQPRLVVFSAEALGWFRLCEPRWARTDCYSQYCRKKLGSGPHRLRHSAGTHLMQRGVSRIDADAILGHYPRDTSLRYMPIQWRDLRRLAARLTLA